MRHREKGAQGRSGRRLLAVRGVWTWQCTPRLLGPRGGPAGAPACVVVRRCPPAGRPAELSSGGAPARRVRIVRTETRVRAEGRPASLRTVGDAAFGEGGADTSTRGGGTEDARDAHGRTCTHENEHAWAVTCARTHWYLSTSQSQNVSIFFFFRFFVFLSLK